MEYELSRLSSRSFEQLIQALALRHLGEGVVIFGDGPDGGREATYTGTSGYSPSGEPWSGYIVAQAKFRQRPLGTEADGPWALKNLQSELAKFAAAEDGRPRPEYYLFATNAVLSPTTGGLKDQAESTLAQAQADWGLKGYDIWDYDKLVALINNDAEVRTRFGWITAGDVLAAMLDRIEDREPDFARTISNFLQKELISDRFVRLEEAGHTTQEPTHLSRVFVDLPVKGDAFAGPDMFLRHLLDETSVIAAAPGELEPTRAPRVVLKGGPGQGKTTLGQFACQVFRAGLLRDSGALTTEGRAAVEATRSRLEEMQLPFGVGPRFPIRVVLTDFARALTASPPPTLLQWICGRVGQRVGTEISTETFRRWLSTYPWFLVLDGLDEVPANAGRGLVMDAIQDFWVDVAQSQGDVAVLATTRPQGYNREFSPDHFEHRDLADLPSELALNYGSMLAEARYGKDGDRARIVIGRLERAVADNTTAHLMRSPLQVAIMVALVDRLGQPPHERWSLFHEYYEIIYQRERERDTDASPILRDYKPDIDVIHERVGLTLQVLTTFQGHSDPRISTAQLTSIVDSRLEQEGHTSTDSDAISAEIKLAAELRLVFLVGAEQDRVGFEIRSLQEFMAAGALTTGEGDKVVERLRRIAHLPSWRNVVLFGFGRCFVERQHLRPLLLSMCRELDIDETEPFLGRTRAGARLAADLLTERIGQHQPKYRRLIGQHALDALRCADSDLPTQLAAGYSPDLRSVFEPRVLELLHSAVPTWQTSARRCLADLARGGAEWAAAALVSHITEVASRGATFPDLGWLSELDLPIDAVTRALDCGTPAALARIADDEDLGTLVPELAWVRAADGAARVMYPTKEPDLRLRLASVGKAGADAIRSYDNELDASRAWSSPSLILLREAVRFVETANAESLAACLRRIASSFDPSVYAAWRSRLPWPMALALGSAQTEADVLRSSDAAGHAAFGDAADWVEAEARWKDGSDLVTELAQPHAFPFSIAGARFSHGRDKTETASDLLDVCEALHQDERFDAAATLAGIALWREGLRPMSTATRLPAAALLRLMDIAAGHAFFVGFGVFTAPMAEDRLADAIRCLPKGAKLTFHIARGGSLSRAALDSVCGTVLNEPTPRGVEVLATALANVEHPLADIPNVSALTSDRYGAHGALVALLSRQTNGASRAFGRQCAASITDSVVTLLNADAVQASEGWDDFLLGLAEGLPADSAHEYWVQDAMNEALSRRVTPLADESLWTKLDLFEPHPLSIDSEA
ncbi:NACHT domain-containing protein [Patulibacter americanus]|uniref:NACHT domain-containing protein n=1 Tax=Patulibacter americanus TaxID=588672 RepID=UPI00040286F0|nr:hypothetical protein [Patulibacter americanus]